MKIRGGYTEAIDNDPAVIALGQHKGFKTVECNLKSLHDYRVVDDYHGIFCKFSINCFWQDSVKDLAVYCGVISELVREDGFIWIAPWNGVPKNREITSTDIDAFTATQISSFKNVGCRVFELSDSLARYYGVHGATANAPLILRGLSIPQKLQDLREY